MLLNTDDLYITLPSEITLVHERPTCKNTTLCLWDPMLLWLFKFAETIDGETNRYFQYKILWTQKGWVPIRSILSKILFCRLTPSVTWIFQETWVYNAFYVLISYSFTVISDLDKERWGVMNSNNILYKLSDMMCMGSKVKTGNKSTKVHFSYWVVD